MANNFGAVDLFGLANASFVCIEADDGMESENDVGADNMGSFLADTDYVFNRKRVVSVTYQANTITGALMFPTVVLGGEMNDYTLTAARIEMDNKSRLRLTIDGHLHEDVDGDGGHLVNTHTVAFPSISHGFGCSLLVGGNIPEEGIQRATWSIEIGHVDEDGNLGNQFIGRSQGVRVEATLEAVSDVEPTVDAAWKLDSFQKPRTNAGMYRVSLSAHKVLAD